MIDENVNLEIMEFVEKNILPRYNYFDKAHNLSHATIVINNAINLGKKVGANINMVYVAAAYHDLGLEGPRAIHHLTSGKIISSDARLKKWFTQEQIRLMKEAVEDHRASASHAPRNIYGKIIAEADRDLEPKRIFQRSIEFGLYNYPDKNKEEHWKRFKEHMENKYSIHGYIHLWIPGSDNEKKLADIRAIINDTLLLKKIFDTLYQKSHHTNFKPSDI